MLLGGPLIGHKLDNGWQGRLPPTDISIPFEPYIVYIEFHLLREVILHLRNDMLQLWNFLHCQKMLIRLW